MKNLFTIGVYGSSKEEFFDKLVKNNIDTFIDIRRRRAVRGSQYAFVNSTRLQNELRERNIKYLHILDLAPTNEIREAQKVADNQQKVAKRERQSLGSVFRYRYENEILSNYDFNSLEKELATLGCERAVLFCVEKEPQACHRSLVSERIEEKYSTKSIHL